MAEITEDILLAGLAPRHGRGGSTARRQKSGLPLPGGEAHGGMTADAGIHDHPLPFLGLLEAFLIEGPKKGVIPGIGMRGAPPLLEDIRMACPTYYRGEEPALRHLPTPGNRCLNDIGRAVSLGQLPTGRPLLGDSAWAVLGLLTQN